MTIAAAQGMKARPDTLAMDTKTKLDGGRGSVGSFAAKMAAKIGSKNQMVR